jgi:3-deoxy-D-manno-octulosonate 8-phosphate phosphatase (KDO 8-P phosphatase)
MPHPSFPPVAPEHPVSGAILAKAKAIKLVATDVDGVLTPSTIVWDSEGRQLQLFNVKDGYALRKIKLYGLKTAIITGRKTPMVQARGEELDFDFIHQGVKDKTLVLAELLSQTGLSLAEVAYMGDDWPDAEVLAQVGLATSPADATRAIKQQCHWVSQFAGGQGAMRELLELIVWAKAN